MTDPDSSFDHPPAALANPIRRSGMWRGLSLLAVVAAVSISAAALLQARALSDVEIPDRAPIPLRATRVTVTDLPVPAGAQVAVLGLADETSRTDFDRAGTSLDVPRSTAALVALYDENRSIIGLSVLPVGEPRDTAELSVRSTAQALLLLAPGILRPDLSQSLDNVGVIEADPAFAKLTAALATDSNLSRPNDELEKAFAEIADRLPIQPPPADQGCDSVVARDAYSAAGACVQPETNGHLITNQQDRWALLYTGAAWGRVCAAAAPANSAGDDIVVSNSDCADRALMVAPGPFELGQPIITDRVREAAAVNLLYSYVGPFADLAGGSAGHSNESRAHIQHNTAEIVSAIRVLLKDHQAFAAALDVNSVASTAVDRHLSTVTSTLLLIRQSDLTEIIPRRSAGESAYLDVLDFYRRAGERMTDTRTDWRWRADAVGYVGTAVGQ